LSGGLIRFIGRLCLILIFACLLSRFAITKSAAGRTYTDVELIPHRPVGLVLGCSPCLTNGRENLYFRHRIQAATQLYRHHKVDFLLVSGDNHRLGYDEPSDMKQALILQGIPGDRIYCDYAGFRTLDSVVRARKVFGQTEITVISQDFQNKRSIFIGRHRGLDVIGFNAEDVTRARGLRTKLREELARVRAVLDVWVLRTGPKFLGPPIFIGKASAQR